MSKLFRPIAILAITLAATFAFAHHGGGSYWTDRMVGPVDGVATRLSFAFPHVTIYLDIPNEQGELVNHAMSIRWTPTVLRNMGWTRTIIEPGDELTVTFVPHKQDPTVGSLRNLEVNGEPLAINPPPENEG